MTDFQHNIRLIKRYKTSYFMMIPYLILFVIFTVLPVVVSIYYGFTNFDMISVPKFIGFTNYKKMILNDALFLTAFKNTLLLATITGPVGYLMSLFIAWFVNDLSPKPRALLTTLFYAPTLCNIYMIWQLIFSGDSAGFLNTYLLKLGIIRSAQHWLTDADTLLPVLIFILLFTSMGTGFLTLVAGFQNIDATLFEAGAVDGILNRWQELWYITLPSMRPQLMISAVQTITSSFGIGSAINLLCGNPSTDYKAWTIMNHISDVGSVKYEVGYACALSTILFLFMILANQLIQKMISKAGN